MYLNICFLVNVRQKKGIKVHSTTHQYYKLCHTVWCVKKKAFDFRHEGLGIWGAEGTKKTFFPLLLLEVPFLFYGVIWHMLLPFYLFLKSFQMNLCFLYQGLFLFICTKEYSFMQHLQIQMEYCSLGQQEIYNRCN